MSTVFSFAFSPFVYSPRMASSLSENSPHVRTGRVVDPTRWPLSRFDSKGCLSPGARRCSSITSYSGICWVTSHSWTLSSAWIRMMALPPSHQTSSRWPMSSIAAVFNGTFFFSFFFFFLNANVSSISFRNGRFLVILTDHSSPDTGDVHTAPNNASATTLEEVSSILRPSILR